MKYFVLPCCSHDFDRKVRWSVACGVGEREQPDEGEGRDVYCVFCVVLQTRHTQEPVPQLPGLREADRRDNGVHGGGRRDENTV